MHIQECACLWVRTSLCVCVCGGGVFLGLAHSLGLSDLVFVNRLLPITGG